MKLTPSMTDKGLRFMFLYYNRRFFQNKISKNYIVEFRKDLRCKLTDSAKKAHRVDGLHNDETREILIHENLRYHQDATSVTLLHEMAHAELGLEGYIGHPGDGCHGLRFQARIAKLFEQGAYDDIL